MKKTGVQKVPDEIVAKLKEYVRTNLKAGDKVPSIRKLSKEWGVSHWSLRTAQALLEQEGWLQIRHGSGVYVSRRAATPTVGVFTAFDVFQPRTSVFHHLVLRAIREYIETQGMNADIYVGRCAAGQELPPEQCGRFVDDVEAGRLDGVVIVSAPSLAGWKNWIASLRFPAVGDHTPYEVEVPSAVMIREAVARLRSASCRRLALLGWGGRKIEDAFREEMTGKGLKLNERWIRGDLHPMFSGAGWEEFREIWSAEREKPDGIVVADDVLMEEAGKAIMEMGVAVPRDLRIAALVNKGAPWRWPFPAIRLEVDPVLYARRLARLLCRLMTGQQIAPSVEYIPYQVVDMHGQDVTAARVVISRGDEDEKIQ